LFQNRNKLKTNHNCFLSPSLKTGRDHKQSTNSKTGNKTTKSYINSPAKKNATKSYTLDIATLDLFERKRTTTFYPKSQETKSSHPSLSHWIRNPKLVEETQRRKTKIAEEQQRRLRKDKTTLSINRTNHRDSNRDRDFKGPIKSLKIGLFIVSRVKKVRVLRQRRDRFFSAFCKVEFQNSVIEKAIKRGMTA
jgi:hypothetical protein